MKKMGRPTDRLKSTQFAIRFDDDTLRILDDYCMRMDKSRTEAVRIAERNLENREGVE